ncbi:MAG: type IV pilus secretin PilQ [Candidatus Krumholzibacteriota bacterium]|nr:type IV pilus secretin PilQ [Candidatus Krumholzibacteriota bacterium]
MMSVRKVTLIVLAGLLLPCLSLSAGDNDSEINALKVVSVDGKARIEISKTGDVEFKVFRMAEPDRLVVDCIGARYDIRNVDNDRQNDIVSKVRTSQFQTDPVLISRIVVDLNKKVDFQLFEDGEVQVVELTGKTDAKLASSADESEKTAPVLPVVIEKAPVEAPVVLSAASVGTALPVIKPEAAEDVNGWEQAPVKVAAKTAVETPKADSPWISNDNEVKKHDVAVQDVYVPVTGTPVNNEMVPWSESYVRGAAADGGGLGMGSKKITIDAQAADIKTVLRTISEFAGVNIVAGKGVEGEVYVHLKDCPWQEALDVVLKANGYGYREEFGMIRVAELSTLLREELEIQTAAKKKDDLLPLVTRIIYINDADAKELGRALSEMVSNRGSISVDEGSNSLIVVDIDRNVEMVSEMVKKLDMKTFQVDINAKLVEIDVETSRELGIDWGVLNLNSSDFPDATGSVEVTAGISKSAGTVRFGLAKSWGEINAILQMLEKTNKANIISNPRITTMDNREASILVGKEIPLIVADEAGNPVTELTKIGIILKVIPHVNTDRTITLDLHPEVSELQSEATAQGGVIITMAEADTRVVVNDGETAVIGGLIKNVETELVTGVPYLKNIPFLGRLFSSQSKINKNTELVIFVTPTIVE